MKKTEMEKVGPILFFCLFVVNGITGTLAITQDSCYYTDDDPYVRYSTKTAYDLVRGRKTQSIPSCKPVAMWSSIRHSTRYPSLTQIEEMKKLDDLRKKIYENHYTDNNGRLCDKDLQLLKNWSYILSPSYDGKLSTQGKDDLRFLAKNTKSKFANIFENPYSSDRFLFYNDGTDGTIESTEAFIDGLFGPEIPKKYSENPALRGSEICPGWKNTVEKNPENGREYERFKESSHFKDMIYNVSHRLGFQFNLPFSTITLMYDSCRYEKAWYIASRPAFCSAFSKEDLKVIEYLEDLRYYYLFSYGNELNKQFACPLAKELVKVFRDVAEGKNESISKPLAIFNFYHTSFHLSLLSLLQFKKDAEPLRSDNYEAMSRREFSTSLINPFTANLIAAFYKCSEGEENRLVFYLNEDVVRYPECDGLCSWNSFYEKIKPIDELCNRDFCNSSSSTIIFNRTAWLLISTLFFAYNTLYFRLSF